jgi:hypothetical protein
MTMNLKETCLSDKENPQLVRVEASQPQQAADNQLLKRREKKNKIKQRLLN